ncbi:MAG: preprotein translocase subunit SecA, partial [Bacteroidia bacterium]|nr:preprotein translocase subunit SecA [Bacteroidia bacterium]
MLNVLKKVFGTKYDKDVKGIMPYVEKTNEYFEEYHALSDDELRNMTIEFRKRISDHLKGIDQDIKHLEEEAAKEEDLGHREEIYIQIDEMKKDRDSHLEDILMEILPEAFAVVKETASRFSNSTEIRVKATEHDRNLAAFNDYINNDGDTAVWKNSWTAAGGDVTWNMVHYDVQLIGGFVLHT